ncbi:hypothetical protein PHSC3_000681 [Chlamydiales bacterium STE3]|nr:hypothetical protein PHSC3_000681 [Chlamydiales bacterium STE3]
MSTVKTGENKNVNWIDWDDVPTNKIDAKREQLIDKANAFTSKYKRFVPIGLAISLVDLAGIVSTTAQAYFKGIAHLILAPCSKEVDRDGEMSKQFKFEKAKTMLGDAAVGTGLLLISPLLFLYIAVKTQREFMKEGQL